MTCQLIVALRQQWERSLPCAMFSHSYGHHIGIAHLLYARHGGRYLIATAQPVVSVGVIAPD